VENELSEGREVSERKKFDTERREGTERKKFDTERREVTEDTEKRSFGEDADAGGGFVGSSRAL
jgi:hypothetical protein